MNRTTRTNRIWYTSKLTGLLLLGCMSVTLWSQQAAPASSSVAAALLPLPEAQRAGATVRDRSGTVLRQGTNGMICTSDAPGDEVFLVNCFHEGFFALNSYASQTLQRLKAAGSPMDAKAVEVEVKKAIETGKVKLPPYPMMGFQIRGPIGGYNAANNSVSKEIKIWQMVIMPYVRGADVYLPEQPAGPNLPWVMGAGTPTAHIMIEHDAVPDNAAPAHQ